MPEPRILKALDMTAGAWGLIRSEKKREELKTQALAKIAEEEGDGMPLPDRVTELEERVAALENGNRKKKGGR